MLHFDFDEDPLKHLTRSALIVSKHETLSTVTAKPHRWIELDVSSRDTNHSVCVIWMQRHSSNYKIYLYWYLSVKSNAYSKCSSSRTCAPWPFAISYFLHHLFGEENTEYESDFIMCHKMPYFNLQGNYKAVYWDVLPGDVDWCFCVELRSDSHWSVCRLKTLIHDLVTCAPWTLKLKCCSKR